MSELPISELARKLDSARREAVEIAPLKEAYPDLTLEDGYEIQAQGVQLRKDLGEKVIGLKMGLTSEAKRKQMNLDSPVYGVLLDPMMIPNEGIMSLKGSIHPRIEPEIAFLIGSELKGKVNREEVLDACTGVASAMEILDSRYRGFKYFSLPDVVADNSSSSYFVMGALEKDFRNLALENLEMEMFINGETSAKTTSRAISGDPVLSVIQLCELLHPKGESIPAGSIVLAGAASTAVALEPGMQVELEVKGLKPTSIRVKKNDSVR